MHNKGVSIIICCFNSEKRIEQTLLHIAGQQVSANLPCEVIVVNNASTDNTAQLAERFWQNQQPQPFPLFIVDEPVPGLSHARKKGIETSNYEHIIFCDDDNWLDNDYVLNVSQLFDIHADTAILGGLGRPVFEDKTLQPSWFNTFQHSYAVGAQADGESFTDSVYGAGMAIKKSILQEVFSSHDLLLDDRKKNSLSSGGDTELCLAVRLNGFKILYSPRLKFQHFITTDRLNWAYLKKLHAGFAKSNLIINLYQQVLNGYKPSLPLLYWLKRGLYYAGIYIKYSFKYSSSEFSLEEINLLTWRTIAVDYFVTNFETLTMFNKIKMLKK